MIVPLDDKVTLADLITNYPSIFLVSHPENYEVAYATYEMLITRGSGIKIN